MKTFSLSEMHRTILELVERYDNFTYDLRGECRVLSGCVAAYRRQRSDGTHMDPAKAIACALERDGILGAWRDPATGLVEYDSCRVFTDQDQALRFARDQEQRSIYNLNRAVEVRVANGMRNTEAPATLRDMDAPGTLWSPSGA